MWYENSWKTFLTKRAKEDMCMEKWLVRTVDYLETLLPEDEFKTLFHELKIWVYEEKSVIKIFYDNDRGGSSFRSFQPLFWNFMVLWTLTPQQVR